ncbi:MAG TPA: chitobiase/beta-hexosaminidase C-terminal domain-containing protein, partial [Planctomycetota bacterium]|nr:chitobiase/beta-hexosaminidase C-terminal domain-containing protein [Planctomycetota bacterium]
DPTDFSYAKRPIDFDRTSIGALLRAQPTFHFDGDLDDVSLWSRALSADEVLELSRGRSPLALGGSPLARSIGVDLREAMRGVSSSAYVRAPFTVESLRPWDRLVLAIAYDDGFVAYLNGVEIARRNAPASVGWTSSAMIERDPLAAMAFETIDASDAAALLVEGDNVLAVHALNARADDDELLVAFELVASGGGELAEGFFADATPGAPNTSPPLRFVADTRFSVDRGLYEAPIVVAISCDTREAEIRFTLDGSVPTPANGFVYEGPIRIETTTTLRAAAFLDGHEPSNVDTHTYIFVEDVLGQTRPDGYPGAWAGFTADYDMDPRIVEDPSYAP